MSKTTLASAALCLLLALSCFPAFAQSQVPYVQTSQPAGTAVFNGTLYLFYTLTGQPNGYLFYVTNNGSTWSTPSVLPQSQSYTMTGEPRATVFDNRLYVFYTATDAHIHYWSMDASGTWNSTAGTVPGSTNYSPGVAGFNGRLYAAWRATGSNTSVFYASTDSTGVWSSTAHLSTGETSRAPSLAAFVASDGVGYLYGVWKNRACQDCVETMWYARMSQFSGWGSGAQVQSGDYPMTARDPFVTASSSGLSVVYTGGYSAGLYYKNLTSSQLWQNEVLVDASAPQASPTAVYFNGQLHAFYNASNYIYEEILY